MTTLAMTPAEEEAYMLAHLLGMPPPHPDIVPNFEDPYSQRYLIVLTTAITLTMSTLLVLVRTYTKRFIHKAGLGWDDYLSVLAWVGCVTFATVGYQTVNYGGAVHMWNVPITKVMKFLQIVNDLYIMYCPVVLITKLSILIQLLHIFAPTRAGATYYQCHFMIWFNVLFYTAIFFAAIFECIPRAKFWNPTIPGTCVDMIGINITTSVINAISDFVLLLLPIICDWKLQMNLRNKLGVSAVFAAAALNGEICGGIVCGCMISLPQLFRHFIPKISTALGLSGRGKSATSCAASEQSDPAQDPRVAFGRSPYGDKDSYVELGERSHPSKTSGPAGRAYEVWTDEVSVCDEEKGLAPVVVDRITHSRGS